MQRGDCRAGYGDTVGYSGGVCRGSCSLGLVDGDATQEDDAWCGEESGRAGVKAYVWGKGK